MCSSDLGAASRRLRRRIVSAGALLIAAIGALAIYDIWHSHRRTLDAASREIANLSNALAEHTARTFQQIDLILRDTVEWLDATEPGRVDGAAAHEYLRRQIAGVPQMRALTVTGAGGEQLYSSRAFPAPALNAADRPDRKSTRLNSSH